MSTIKRISGNYTLQSIGATDNVNINTNLFTINGNLLVNGNTTSINTTNTNVQDNIIVLNANIGPTTTPTLNSGLQVDRGNQANVFMIWNETVKAWQITNDGSNYGNIMFSGSTAGNINITGLSLYDTANTVTMYTGTVSSGKSGLFVDNTNGNGQELATKSAAIAYSIIFG
jgi:hypothetical protein